MVWQKMTPEQRKVWDSIKDTTVPSPRLSHLARMVGNNPPPKGFKGRKK